MNYTFKLSLLPKPDPGGATHIRLTSLPSGLGEKKKKKEKADKRISFSGYCSGLAQVCQVCFAVHGLVSARMPLLAREEALDFIFPFNLNSPPRDDATN